MMATQLKPIPWKRPEEIMRMADERDLTSDGLLALESRSFYGPIKILGLDKGENEADKETEIRAAYNIHRELDEGEDASEKLDKEDKKWVINKFCFIVNEVVRCGSEETLENIIKGEDFRSVTKKLKAGAASRQKRVFIEHFGRGAVLRELYALDREARDILGYGVTKMGNGMIAHLERGPIQTVEQLDNYAYHVAGGLGETITKLVKLKDGVELDISKGERFGKYLQLTNIIKNVRSDFEEGRIFFPAELRPRGISHEYMMDGQGLDAQEARNIVLGDMLELTEVNFEPSIDYIIGVHSHLPAYKAFLLGPFITAEKTLRTVKAARAGKVFRGDEDAVKIRHGMENIIDFSRKIVHLDEGRRVNEWLEQYKKNPAKYSFVPQNGGKLHYQSWSSKWLKEAS